MPSSAFIMASTLPHHSSDKPMFIPPQKRRAVSGKTGTFTPYKSTSKPTIYGDQILNVQVIFIETKTEKSKKKKGKVTFLCLGETRWGLIGELGGRPGRPRVPGEDRDYEYNEVSPV